jgi:hypothetical protein
MERKVEKSELISNKLYRTFERIIEKKTFKISEETTIKLVSSASTATKILITYLEKGVIT